MSPVRRTVLFIVTSYWAYGELAIATEFARRMAGTEFRPLFLVPPSHRELIAGAGLEHQLLVPGARKINRILLQDIQHVHRPALVVLADFMNFAFCDRHYGLCRDDLSIFDCPVGTFDDFAWGRPGAWLDTYGFRAKHQDEITLDGLAFRLRPCPLNHPAEVVTEPDVHPYPLLESVAELDRPDRAGVRREFGLTGGRPVVLVTGATWQRMHAAYPRVTAFVGACHTMLERLLTRLLGYADVVAVGPQLVFRDGAPPGFHPLGPLEPDRFRRLIQTVDLHISNNIVSVSLHRLALAGVPSVVLMSSLFKQDGEVRWVGRAGTPALTGSAEPVVAGVDYLYPFRMFPVGWYHFLHSLLAGNPFGELVPELEVFDEAAGLATIVPMLEAGPERTRLARMREQYLESLRKLPEIDTILRQLGAP